MACDEERERFFWSVVMEHKGVICMDLLQLRYFQVVARHEHMTRAARELSIAQPSLSHTITHLEEELGVPLFTRKGRNIYLNQFGRAFMLRVTRILDEIEDAKRELADLSGAERGRIALAAVNISMLPEILKVFLTDHPHVSFRLFHHHSPRRIYQLLESGELDLCVASPPIQQEGIITIPLITEEIFLVVPHDHPFAARRSIALAEAAHEHFISLRSGYSLRDMTDELCRQAGFEPDILVESEEPSAISRLVSTGFGVAFGSELNWRNSFDTRAVPLHITDPVCQRTIGLCWREGHYLSQAACDFRDAIIAYFACLPRPDIRDTIHDFPQAEPIADVK
ncbi:LysR family transcriptional regulator [Ktedonobacteria bacterium brp13]|nr:LysR family transcriptional regulator [Ktedonobacteria bacterium brp13]